MPSEQVTEVSSFSGYLKHLLVPVIRFCLRHSIKLQELVEISKSVYLEVARERLEQHGLEANGSRLSLMTGVHRRDVVRFSTATYRPRQPRDIISRVIGQWSSDERFRTRAGKPRVLSFAGGQGRFAELVAVVSREIKAYSVLNEMERAGIIVQTPRGIRLRAKMYIPKHDLGKGFYFLERDLDDIICAVEENLSTQSEIKNLHIKTEYDNIPRSLVPQIRDWLLRQGSSFHEKVRNYLSQFDRDINPAATGSGVPVRIGIGSFSLVSQLHSGSKEKELGYEDS